MAYDLKSVFYLDTTATIAASTTGAGSAQLDLSAYIDPIARGRTKGTGLAIYRVHYSILNSDTNDMYAPDDSEVGIATFGLLAGAGLGDTATGAISVGTDANTTYGAQNNLLISAGYYYSPASYPGATAKVEQYLMPSDEVPYVVVRDNVCLVYSIDTSKKFVDDVKISFRLECAQVSLDQATLNQLLRTQTV